MAHDIQEWTRDVVADDDDAWLRVNVLAEFVFCPRAGMIEWSKQRDDTGEDDDEEPRASVNYMPRHDFREIVEDIERTTQSLIRWLPIPIVSLLAAFAAGWLLGWYPAVLGVFLTAGLTKPIFTALERLRTLKEILTEAQSRNAREPDPAIGAIQKIDWWELRMAGFEPYRPERKLDDDETRLAGRPKYILRHGHTLIPVFQKRMDGLDPEKIHPKHEARIAAYCYLLEKCADVESPYGIVLFGSSFEGRAINAEAAWMKFCNSLQNARHVIKQSRLGKAPEPAGAHCCSGCRHGKPIATGRSIELFPILRNTGVDGREYRSDCGDRYDWIPPHTKALKKGMQR